MDQPLVRAGHFVLVVVVGLAVVACAETTKTPAAEAELVDARVQAGAPDASPTDAGRADAGRLDASKPVRPPPPRECNPGQYTGDFSCVISGLLPWVGKLSFALVEQTSEAGEFTMLSIVPGTRIMGSDDSLQGMFTAELEGSFDCMSGELAGRLLNGVYLFAGVMEYHLEGPLAGRYASDGGQAGFDGSLGKLTSSDFEALGELGPSATCTWHALRTSDATGDAGADASR
jgi:hypothetical protein